MKQESFCADGFDENDHFEKIMEKYSDMVYRLAYALVKTDMMRMIFIRRYFCVIFGKNQSFWGRSMKRHGFFG